MIPHNSQSYGRAVAHLMVIQRIEHAHYQRHILNYNPKRYDDHGYELEDEDEDEEADEEAALKNAYGEVSIES